jgi:hypothetical protein
MADPRLREWSAFDEPILPEESALYVPVLTIVAFGLLTALLAVTLRCWLRPRRTSASSIAPLLAGAGATLLLCGLSPSEKLLPVIVSVAALMLTISAVALWIANTDAGRTRYLGIGVVIVVGAFGLRVIERPTTGFPLRDNFDWQLQLADADSDFRAGTELHDIGWVSVPRRFTRGSADALAMEGASFLFDSRNRLTPDPSRSGAQAAELLMAAALTADPQRVLLVGCPEKRSTVALRDRVAPQFTFACDTPQLVPLALDGTGIAGTATVQRSLASTDGPFDLVFLRGSGMWEERRSVLRVELLRQASLRLDNGGVCVFACAAEQLVPGLLPQWIAEFRRVYDEVAVYVLPDGLRNARVLVVGRDPVATDDGDAWPQELRALQVELPDDLGDGSYWMFRGPLRPTERFLQPTTWKLIPELDDIDRAAAVLAELAQLEKPGTASLVRFYAEQLEAQEYSVHDTFLDRNPFAIESSAAALDALLVTTRAYPESVSLEEVWSNVGVILVEQREVAWMQEYFTALYEELGWRRKEVLLVLAHAAIETLDFERADELVEAILREAPDFGPALELRELVAAGETVPHDAHAGHNH